MIAFATFCVALLMGSMAFFSFVMAPLVFKELPGAVAGMFIRKVFPWFYALVILLSLLAALAISFSLLAYHGMPLTGWACAAVFVSAVFCRQWLMGRINATSDAMKAAPAQASVLKTRFDAMHRLSVAINVAQLTAVVWVFWRLVD